MSRTNFLGLILPILLTFSGLDAQETRLRDQPAQNHNSRKDSLNARLGLLLEIGYSAFNAGDYDVAKESFLKALAVDSTQLDALRGLGQVAFLSGDKKAALGWYERVIAIDSTDSEAFFNCGLAASDLENSQLALQMFQKAVALNPEDWKAWFEIGRIYGHQADYRKAMHAFEKAHQHNPDDWLSLFFLGITADVMQEYDRAVQWLLQAAQKKSDDAEIFFKLGLAYYRLNQFAKADSAFSEALALNSDHGASWLWRGITAKGRKQITLARHYARRSLPLLKDNIDKVNGFLLLADSYLYESHPDSALLYLEQASTLAPKDLRVHEQLARAYLAKGDYKKAREEYAIIEKLKTENKQ